VPESETDHREADVIFAHPDEPGGHGVDAPIVPDGHDEDPVAEEEPVTDEEPGTDEGQHP
jgi:hypothetical protein